MGSTIQILNKPWRVSGIIGSGKLARIVFPLDVLQELTSNEGKVSQIYLKLDDPKNINAVVHELKDKLPDYSVYSAEELVSMYNPNNIPALREFTFVIMAIGVVIGFAVVCLSMYMAVLQRTREIGILKSLGVVERLHSADHPGRGGPAGGRRHAPRHPHELRRPLADA